MSERDTNDLEEETARGSTQITLPYIESGMRIRGILIKKLAFLIPAFVPVTASVMLNFMTGNTSSFSLTIPATGILIAIFWLLAKTSDWEFHHPWDTVTAWFRRRRWIGALSRFPLSHEDLVVDAEHGYARMYDSGIGEQQDGRFVAFVRAPSRNTHKTTESEQNRLVIRLTGAIRQKVDGHVRIFQTTFDTDPDEYLEQWRGQRHSERFAGAAWRYAREYLKALLGWGKTEEERWDPRERRTYLVVEARPWEVRKRSTAEDTGLTDTAKESVLRSSGLTAYQRKQLDQLVKKRARKVEQVARSIGEGDSDEVGMVGPGEHALLISKFWCSVEPKSFENFEESDRVALSVWPDVGDYARLGDGQLPDFHTIDQEHRRTTHRPTEVEAANMDPDAVIDPVATASVDEVEAVSDGGETMTRTVKESVDEPEIPEEGTSERRFAEIREGLFNPLSSSGNRPHITDSVIQERLAASHFDVNDGYVEVADQLCKSFWLASWPKEPASNFMEKLQNMRGVDYDLTIRADSPARSDAIAELEDKIEDTGASIEERMESRDPETSVMSDEIDYYVDMYGMLKKTSAIPWWVNAYVTVRVGPKQAYETIEEETVAGFGEETNLPVDVAKKRALDSAVEELLEVVESEPMAMAPITDKSRADLLFKSAWPTAPDAYNEDTKKEKRTLTLSGSVAATYPFATSRVQEPGGVLFGRNLADGQMIVADQFERDGASHRLTCGRSGSGKTFFVGDQALQWWLAGGSAENGPNNSGDEI